MDKYALIYTDYCVFHQESGDVKLYRIRALKDFGNIKAGRIGGYVESTANLSQYNSCWVHDNAKISGKATIHNNVQIFDNVQISDYVKIYDNVIVYGDAKISDFVNIHDRVTISDAVQISGYVSIYDSVQISDHVSIKGKLRLSGSIRLGGFIEILEPSDLFVVGPIGSRSDYTYFFRKNIAGVLKIGVICGGFYGNIDEFLCEVKKNHGNSHHAAIYEQAAKMAKLQITLV